MVENGSKYIAKLREKIDAGEVEMSDNLVKAIKFDWFGNVHPSLAKARIKQIPHSWFDLDALNEQETEVFDRWVHKGWDADKIAGDLRRSKESIETDLFVIKNKLRMTQEPNKGDWQNFLLLSGRGFGKTRSGAELVKEYVRRGWAKRIALISPTPGKARDDLLRKLDSGLLQIYPEGQEPKYLPTKKRVDWKNGAEANIYSGANPEEIRGPEFDLAWIDEFAAFKYPRETWDNLQFALRLGDHPQTIITTTPKPIPTLINIVEDEHTIISKGSTYENKENLPQSFYDHVVSKYEGTTIGQQEIYADILSDSKRALWSRDVINDFRLENSPAKDVMKRCDRIVVGIDPAVGDKKENDETGVIVAGATNDTGWVLEDGSMSQARPQTWADRAINLFHKYQADKIIAETNQGGQMVEQTLRTIDSNIPYKGVRASKGKRTRAEPVAALYEQGKVHHVGVLGTLEDQLVTWEPGQTKSPDRLDALVYALSELMLGGRDRKQGWSMYL